MLTTLFTDRGSVRRSLHRATPVTPIDVGRQRGVSLIELMIGLAISLVILAGVLTVVARISVASGESVQMTRLNQQMRATMDFITQDLQRAGYVNWRAALDDCPSHEAQESTHSWSPADFFDCVAPVMSEMGRILPDLLAQGGSDCILYSYDIDGNGTRNSGDFELFGFKLAGGAVRTRTAGDTHSCDTGIWQAISDSILTISALNFTMEQNAAGGNEVAAYRLFYGDQGPLPTWQSSGPIDVCVPGEGGLLDDKCLWRRVVTIELEGHLSSDAAVSMRLVSKVKIKNDHFQGEVAP